MKTGTAVGFVIILIPILAYFAIHFPAGAKIPVHWNANMAADQYVTPQEFIWYLLGMLGVYAFLALAPRIFPRREHVERFGRTYEIFIVSFAVVISSIMLAAELYAAGYVSNPTTIVKVGVGALLLISGTVAYISRSNWIIGVRTPWGLESERAWRASNVIGGASLGVAGIAMLLGANGYLVLGIILAGTVAAIVAAYAVWRREHGR